MTASHLSLLTSGASPGPQHDGTASQGTMQLNLPAGAQVHVHLGTALSGAAGAASPAPAASARRGPVTLVLAGVALLGAGYLAGSRTAAPRAGGDGVAAPLAASALIPAPESPQGADIPQALREQLARPPVVMPAPGAPMPANRAGAPPRNAFGLGD